MCECVCVCVYTRDWAQYFLFSRSHSKDGPHCRPYLPFLFWDRVLLSGLGWTDTSYVVQTGAKCDSPALLSSAAGVAVLHHQAQIHLPFKASSLISKWLPQLMHSVYYSNDDHHTTWALQLTLFFSTSFELWSPCCFRIYSVDQTDLEFTGPVPASQALRSYHCLVCQRFLTRWGIIQESAGTEVSLIRTKKLIRSTPTELNL